jgi:mRNA-degrading endonuclease toxin of MazEF toxin-antitoxin module
MMKENWVYCRGDIYCANLDPVVGSEQGGIRPLSSFRTIPVINTLPH